MSWSIEEHIGEGRPWPEQVVVYRGETDESLTYARRSLSDVNKMVELMDTLAAENAKLRELVERLRTQLADMTESVGRVEERCAKTFEVGKRWMAKAARFEAENAKLRELCEDMWEGYNDPRCEECHLKDTPTCADCPICAREASVIDRMRELGVDE